MSGRWKSRLARCGLTSKSRCRAGAAFASINGHHGSIEAVTEALSGFNCDVSCAQQRSTTLHLLLLAFRQAARELIDSPMPQMLDGLGRNPGPLLPTPSKV